MFFRTLMDQNLPGRWKAFVSLENFRTKNVDPDPLLNIRADHSSCLAELECVENLQNPTL